MSRPSLAYGLWHIALNVRELAPMEQFYVELMGMAVEWRPDPDNVYLSSGRDNLALHVMAGLPPIGTVGVLDHIGFFVDSKQAVDDWHVYLTSRGLKPDTEPRTHRDGARSFYFRDPEGNRVQLLCHPPILAAEPPPQGFDRSSPIEST